MDDGAFSNPGVKNVPAVHVEDVVAENGQDVGEDHVPGSPGYVDFQIRQLRKEVDQSSRQESNLGSVGHGVRSNQRRKIASDLDMGSVTAVQSIRGRPGLRNIGNSCYINAVIQCLSVVDKAGTGAYGKGLIKEYEVMVSSLNRMVGGCLHPAVLRELLGK